MLDTSDNLLQYLVRCLVAIARETRPKFSAQAKNSSLPEKAVSHEGPPAENSQLQCSVTTCRNTGPGHGPPWLIVRPTLPRPRSQHLLLPTICIYTILHLRLRLLAVMDADFCGRCYTGTPSMTVIGV